MNIQEIIIGIIKDGNLPWVWVICDRCDGHGYHSNPSFDGTSIEFWDDDPDFAEEYFSGVHDIKCDECDGSGKVKAIDFDELTDKERADVKSSIFQIAESYAIQEAERRAEMGAAYYYG